MAGGPGGIGGLNPLNINPNPIIAPQVLPEKLPPLTEETKEKQGVKEQQLPGQPPKSAVINKSTQTFSNILSEIGLPNTPENNQIAQTLASYGQPINKQTMSQVSRMLSTLNLKGANNIEAGLILILNGLKVNSKAAESIKNLLTTGGMSQNLISLNKDLRKLVEKLNNNDFNKELERKIDLKNNKQPSLETIKDANSNPQKNTSEIKLLNQPNNKEEKVEESTSIIKRFNDEESEQEASSKNFNSNQNSKANLPIKSNLQPYQSNLVEVSQNYNLNNSTDVIKLLSSKAENVSKTISNLISIDVLKNPNQFPHQISMLKKYFSELELDINELKQILESSFPELRKELLSEEENIFLNMLQLTFDSDSEKSEINKSKLSNTNNDAISDILNELYESTSVIDGNLDARNILTKAEDCMCIPIPMYVNGKTFNSEIVIKREDKSNKKVEIGDVPLKIQLAVDTKNMGKVSIDMSNLKKDLQIYLSVENKQIKAKVDNKLKELENNLKKLPFDLKPLACNVNPKMGERTSLLLPQKYKVMSMSRIEGVV